MSKKDKKSSKKGDEDIKRDQKLQAILLADTFRGTFNPITWDMPTVLLPLINIPMLEYTVEFLAQNGVEEVSQNNKPCTIFVMLFFHLVLCWVFCYLVCLDFHLLRMGC